MRNSGIEDYFSNWLKEDIGEGDHSSLACIPAESKGKAKLLVKEKGIIAGLRVAGIFFKSADPELEVRFLIEDGKYVTPGDIAFNLEGPMHSILKCERLVLNIMQRMSGIATSTHEYVSRLHGLKTQILDTRKTTPGFRVFEKEAVRIGGGTNHRMGLYDMIMLKDNHIDYAGGIRNALLRTRDYITRYKLPLKVEIEARSLEDVEIILSAGGADRIMLDNFNLQDTRAAVNLIKGRVETESSGGITLETIRSYAECGLDYISVGALTHHIKSIDLSLKAS